jgi:membrane fusion protein (multidrug efflux system)
MLKKFIITATILIVIVGALFSIKTRQFAAMKAAGESMVMPPETVTATAAKEESWESSLNATGSVAAVQGVTVSAEIAGKVAKIAFESGTTVAAGDLLVQLDTSVEDAQMRAAEAASALAKTNLARGKELLEKNTMAQADWDAADAQAKQADAQLEGIKAAIAKKNIRAPFAGRLGLRLVNLGQNLKEGDPIVALQTLDPVYVNFALPQQSIGELAPGGLVRITTDAAPDAVFEGKINAVSPEVDVATRSVRVQATVPNTGEKLRPGMFANVDVVLPNQKKVLAIPATAVLYAPYGDSVFVIEEKKNAKSGKTEKILKQEFIRVGVKRGDFVAVTSGLSAGDVVVTSGVFKLRPGTAVVVDNTLAPNSQLAPKPENT